MFIFCKEALLIVTYKSIKRDSRCLFPLIPKIISMDLFSINTNSFKVQDLLNGNIYYLNLFPPL